MTTTAVHPLGCTTLDSVACDDERTLVERALASPDGFAAIYSQHYQAVAGYIYRRAGDPHLTEDLTSEVFIAAMRSLRRFRGQAPLRLWLLKIATNTLNRRLRGLRRERTGHVGLENADGRPGACDGSAEARDELRRAQNLILQLPVKHQAVLALVGVEQLTNEEAALVLGVRVGTVKSRLSRAREALRTLIKQREQRP